MNCYSRWVDTLATLSDYLSKKMISRRIGNTSGPNEEEEPVIKENNGNWRRMREGTETTAIS